MKLIDNIRSRFSEMWSARSASEKRLLVITACVALVSVIVLSSVFMKRKQKRLEEDIAKYENAIDEINRIGPDYRAAVAREKEAEQKLKSGKTSLLTTISKAAGAAGFELKDLDEKSKPVKGTDVEQKRVQIENVKKLDVDQVHKFFEEIEGKSNKRSIHIEKLHVKTRFDEPELLDIKNVEAVTWVKGKQSS